MTISKAGKKREESLRNKAGGRKNLVDVKKRVIGRKNNGEFYTK